MARLTVDGERLVCDRCRLQLAMIAKVGDPGENVTRRVLFLMPGWRHDRGVVTERARSAKRRRAGYPPPLMPRRLAIAPRSKRGVGTRSPGMIAPVFPDLGLEPLVFVCTDCGARHPVRADEIGVVAAPDISYFEAPPTR